jgi:hypothetical protein
MLTGAAGARLLLFGLTETVALSLAVAPLALLATSLNVVVPLMAMVVEPLIATDVPLMVADVAFVVCQLTRALLVPDSVAEILAVGAFGVGVPTEKVTSADAGPTWCDAL